MGVPCLHLTEGVSAHLNLTQVGSDKVIGQLARRGDFAIGKNRLMLFSSVTKLESQQLGLLCFVC